MKKLGFPLVLIATALLSFGFLEAIFANKDFPKERTFEVVYDTHVKNIPSGTKEIKVWIPLGQSTTGQEVVGRVIEAPVGYEIKKDPKHGNEILYLEASDFKANEMNIRVKYLASRSVKSFKDENAVDPWANKYLENSRLTASTAETRQWASEAIEGLEGTHERARGLYDRVMEHMTYDKKTPGYGNGDTSRACSIAKGNCTDFHSLFITMSRDVAIPARFQIGFTVPKGKEGKIKGYHCWAEYYVEGDGWYPIDISDAWKKPEWTENYFSNFDTNKFMLSMGRDIELEPSKMDEPINIFFYPHVEVDGKKYDDFKTKFKYANLK